jgi:hypothetical protein
LFTVGRFGETEPDIDAYGLHNASVMVLGGKILAKPL